LRIPFLDHPLDLADHFFVFQTDGEENGFQWEGMCFVNASSGMEFGPVEKAIEGFLVFFAQTFAELFPLSMFLIQKMTERHNCPAHISSKDLTGTDPILKINEIAEYSSFDDVSRKS
jgi:hypothetical protein